jgi:hypothetical protein
MNRLDVNKTQVFLLGTSTYEEDEELHDLESVLYNITELRKLFTSKLIGIPNTHVAHKIDLRDKTYLLKRLTKIGKKKGTKNLILYYAGHGVLDDDDKLYLTLSNSTGNEIYNDGLSVKDLDYTLSQCKLKNIIMILDCCLSERAFEQIRQRNYCVIASSAKTKTSKYPVGKEFSAFTQTLIEVLKCGIKNDAEDITLYRLFKEVKAILDKKNLPEPKIANTNEVQDVIIAKNNFNAQLLKPAPFSSDAQQKNALEFALEKALQGFDYEEHKDYFEDYLDQKNVGAMIIHGKHGYGQAWLFKRLLLLQQIHSSTPLTHPNNYGYESDLKGILETIKEEFKRTGEDIRFQRDDTIKKKISKISKVICQRLKSGDDVVIGFRNIFKMMAEEHVQDFCQSVFNSFWIHLHRNVSKTIINNKLSTRCLLFFVEDQEVSEEVNTYCESIVENCLLSARPLLFPSIKPICEKTIHHWVKAEMKYHDNLTLRNKFRKYTLKDCRHYLDECVKHSQMAFFEEVYYDFNLSFKES